MLYTQENLLLLTIAGLFLFYLFRNVIIEGLTGNAPVELPLPKYLKRSEPTTLSEKDKSKLDKREIPTGYDDKDMSYTLEPGMIRNLDTGDSEKTADDYAKEEEARQLKEKNDLLEKQNAELLKRLSKQR